jgi:aromatic ring-opening dioxygenase catalytic subunit (LigB family)
VLVAFSSGSICNMTEQQQHYQQPVWLLSHGGGPCFFMTGGSMTSVDANSEATKEYKQLANTLKHKPSAILLISAHHRTHGPSLEIVGDSDDEISE